MESSVASRAKQAKYKISKFKSYTFIKMQRLVIFALISLSVVAYVSANDLNEGQREDGDVLVVSRRLLRPPIPGKPMVAKSGYNTAGKITAISAKNAPGSDATVSILKGGIGSTNVVVAAVGELGTGLDVQLDIYAIVDAAGASQSAVDPEEN